MLNGVSLKKKYSGQIVISHLCSRRLFFENGNTSNTIVVDFFFLALLLHAVETVADGILRITE